MSDEYTEEHADGQASPQNGHQRNTTDAEAQQRRHGVSQDAGSDADDTEDEMDSEDLHSVDALEDQFILLEEEVATLVADVHDLALYTKLNITGFMKILKVRRCLTVLCPTGADHVAETRRESRPHCYSALLTEFDALETNRQDAEDHIRSRLSRETSILQVQLGQPYRQAVQAVRPCPHPRSPRPGRLQRRRQPERVRSPNDEVLGNEI